MKQWDTADWVLPAGKSGPGAANHPCVIVSPDWVCQNPDHETLNIIAASTHRTQRPPRAHGFLLDAADGMDWETLVKLHILWAVPKKELRPRKAVTPGRRRPLGVKLIQVLGLLPA